MPELTNEQFCITAICSSLAIILFTYAVVSKRSRSYVNVLTPFLLLQVPTYFVLEAVNVVVQGYSGSRYAYIYLYVTYAVGVIARAIGFLCMPQTRVSLLIRMPVLRLPGIPYGLLALAGALYAPVLVEHLDLLSSPREIYALTRTGYGVQSFLSTCLVYVGFILLLSKPQVSRGSRFLYIVAALAILYMHGSKGQIFAFFLIWLYFAAFVQRRVFDARRLVVLGIGTTILMTCLFYLTFPDSLRDDLLSSIAGYSSEYTRNATLVIDDSSLDPQYGRLMLEDNFYSFIPRAFYPDKRKDFGSLWLASHYYPARFQDERGAPAFGLGVEYADFGVFAIIYYAGVQLVFGILAKILIDALARRPNPGDFVFLLVFLDVPLIPTGTGFPLPMYYLIALLVKCLDPRKIASTPMRMHHEPVGALP